jgi:hypothetical protein
MTIHHRLKLPIHLATLAGTLLLGAFAAPLSALADPIETDGPDFVESTEVVGKGRFQFETDFSLERDRRNDERTRTFSTPTLLRFGISETVELRLANDFHTRQTTSSATGDTTESGRGDVVLGMKWKSHDADKKAGTPDVAWILHFDTPSGSEAFRGRGVRPSLRSVIGWELKDDYSLGLMPGLAYESRADGHRYLSGILGLVIGKQFTERFRMFAETATAQLARSENGGIVSTWNIGTAYLLTDNWQIGGRVQFAANRNSPSNTIVFEIAGRF